MDVINKEVLTPARSEGEPNADKGKAHNHVPGPNHQKTPCGTEASLARPPQRIETSRPKASKVAFQT